MRLNVSKLKRGAKPFLTLLHKRRNNKVIDVYYDAFSVELSKSWEDMKEVLEIERECWPLSQEAYRPDSKPRYVWQANKKRLWRRQRMSALYVARYMGKEPWIVKADKESGDRKIPMEQGQIVGQLTAYRCAWANADAVGRILEENDITWDRIVSEHGFPPDFYDGTIDGKLRTRRKSVYDPKSEVMHLISMGVREMLWGAIKTPEGTTNIANLLAKGLQVDAKKRGVRYIAGITTLSLYGRLKEKMSLNEYVAGINGSRIDPNISRYERSGAKIVCPVPNYMPCDARSDGHGALVVFDLTKG